MKMAYLLAAILVFTASYSRGSSLISASEAKKHIGENAVVSGKVSEVHITKSGTALVELDGKYPNEAFTAVWLARNNPPVSDLRALEGKKISVRGKISSYIDKPEIIINSMSQISN